MNTDDRRVRKTKKALKEGLAELMLEKELRNITVKELTDKADIHRATFYSHFLDVYDLYEQMENTAFEELSSIIVSDPTHTYNGIFNVVINYVYHNGKMCRLFLDRTLNRSFYDRISIFLEEKYSEIYLFESGQSEITEEWKYMVNYHMQGCLSIISRWVKDNFACPKEKIVEIIEKVDTNFDKLQ
jgi:Transcriptional regulator